MTPTEPTPVAPETAPTPVPTPPAAAPPAPTAPPAFDPTALAPEAQAYLKAQIDAADLKARTGSKANAAAEARAEMAAQVARALGLQTDEPPSPEILTQHLEAARDQAWSAGVELQVYRAAAQHGANPDALLDSRGFISSLDDMVDLDPRSPEFAAALEAKVQAAAAKYPAAPGQAPTGPRPDPSQGTRGTGPDANSLIAAAKAKGDWRTAISLENQKLQQL